MKLLNVSTWKEATFKYSSSSTICLRLPGFAGQFKFRYVLGHLEISYVEQERILQLYSDSFDVKFFNNLKQLAENQYQESINKIKEML